MKFFTRDLKDWKTLKRRALYRLKNLSLYWKVGFVIGSCFFINLFIALYFYFLFYHVIHLEKNIPYNYEILTVRALAYIHQKQSSPKSFIQFATNLEEIINQLDSAKNKYPEIQKPLEEVKHFLTVNDTLQFSPEILKRIEEDFLKIHEVFKKQRLMFEEKLDQYRKFSKYFKFVLFFVMIMFLVWGTWAFYFMVKRPLDKIVERLKYLIEGREETGIENLENPILTYSAQDEIGKVINKVNEILKDFRMLRVFKQTIENDETAELVYERLGYYLFNILGLENFIIYQVSNSQNLMEPVYISKPNLATCNEIMFNADRCRAKRTGQIVSSLNFPQVCKYFPYNDREGLNHYCIPMMYGGRCIGMVAIYLCKYELDNFADLEATLKKAQTFVKEATPVIEAKRYAESLRERSFRDPLTGLYNRHFLDASLDTLVAQVLRRESVMGILMCDLDYFKSVNDKFGHDVGDLVLKETAAILASNVRKSDLVIRFGGEEFLILLVDIGEGESVKIADKLRHLIETHDFKIPQGVLKKTISIGVAEFPIDTAAIWEAIKFADVALYKAKEMGRNKVVRFKKEFWSSDEY